MVFMVLGCGGPSAGPYLQLTNYTVTTGALFRWEAENR